MRGANCTPGSAHRKSGPSSMSHPSSRPMRRSSSASRKSPRPQPRPLRRKRAVGWFARCVAPRRQGHRRRGRKTSPHQAKPPGQVLTTTPCSFRDLSSSSPAPAPPPSPEEALDRLKAHLASPDTPAIVRLEDVARILRLPEDAAWQALESLSREPESGVSASGPISIGSAARPNPKSAEPTRR